MENSQTPLDYKEYFNNKFISNFKDFISYLLVVLPYDSSEKNDINKINELLGKLNYDKIISKMAQNTKLIEVLTFLNKNKFSEELSLKLLNVNEKYWTLMPSLNINKILMKLETLDSKEETYEKINSLHICAVTYSKVLEQLESCKDTSAFNPFENVINTETTQNIDIESMFKGVEVKNISAYEMLMENLINQQMDNKMDDYMNNIKEDDVNEAASKLHDVLNSESFQNNKGTSKILSDMLNNIKHEVINLKSESDNLKGKQGVEQLLGIAQKVAGNMMGTIKESNVSVLDIWDATSNLAKNTVQSDALNIVDNLIRNNIEANLKKTANPVVDITPDTETNVEETDQGDKTRKRRTKKRE